MGTAFDGAREPGRGAFEGITRAAARGAAPDTVNAWAAGRRPKGTRRVMARGWQRLRLRRRIALALAGVAFTATLLLAVLADFGAAGMVTAHSHTPPVLGALLIGLLLTGFFMLAAVRVSGPLSPAALAALYASLDDALDSARQVDGGLRAQLTRTTQQSATARHLMDELRTLTDVANALEHGVALLRDSTSQIYGGGAPTAEARAQTTRAVAVAASQIGGAAEQATALCQRLRIFTNQVIAEAHTLGENGQQAAHHAASVAAALQRIESALSMVGTSSSGGLRAVGAVQGALARVAAQPRGAHLAPADAPAPPAIQTGGPRAGLRAPAPPRRAAWQHTGRTVPRLGRTGRPMTHPHLQGGDTLGASGYRAGSGGPRPGGNHPSTGRHMQRPWYTDEPAPGAGDDQPTRPESVMHPTPRPDTGEWPRE